MRREQFLHQGEMQDNVDFLFGRDVGERSLLIGGTAEEIEIMREIRWWSGGDWRSRERIFPGDLAERMREQRRAEVKQV